MAKQDTCIDAVELFFSYSHNDESLRGDLEKHLSILKRRGIITAWHDRRITAGTEWSGQIDKHLESAAVILLLVSADFLASDYCYDVEMKRALERHERNDARVIPVILRPVDWHGAPFSKLQALPTDGTAVTRWPNSDAAFEDITRGIREAISDIREPARLDRPDPQVGEWHIRISGTIQEFDQSHLNEIVNRLRDLSGDVNLTITNVKPGSVVITMKGEKSGFNTIAGLFLDGSLSAELKCSVEDIGWGTPVTSDGEDFSQDEPPPYRDEPTQRLAPNQGRIKKLTDKGFGFIETASGDLFFHMSSLIGVRYEDLYEGQIVEFEEGVGPKGGRAENIRVAS